MRRGWMPASFSAPRRRPRRLYAFLRARQIPAVGLLAAMPNMAIDAGRRNAPRVHHLVPGLVVATPIPVHVLRRAAGLQLHHRDEADELLTFLVAVHPLEERRAGRVGAIEGRVD